MLDPGSSSQLEPVYCFLLLRGLKGTICFLFIASSPPPTTWRMCSEQPMIICVLMEPEHLFHHCQVWATIGDKQWTLRDSPVTPWTHPGNLAKDNGCPLTTKETPTRCHPGILHIGQTVSQDHGAMRYQRLVILFRSPPSAPLCWMRLGSYFVDLCYL